MGGRDTWAGGLPCGSERLQGGDPFLECEQLPPEARRERQVPGGLSLLGFAEPLRWVKVGEREEEEVLAGQGALGP